MRLSVNCQAIEVDRRNGIWCNSCSLPAVTEIDWSLVLVVNMHTLGRFTVAACEECGEVETRPR